MKVVCIVPARGGSKRLPRKNLFPLLGKKLIEWPLLACRRSKYLNIENIFVSSEDTEILQAALDMGVQTIERPIELASDSVWTQEVLKHAVKNISEDIDIVVRVQANSPQVTADKIDECIEKLINNDLWEVFTVDQNGIEDAAIHVMKERCVFQSALSVYKGVVTTDYIDIHTLEDIKMAEKKLEMTKTRK